jgi:hypothetical protein
VSIIEKAASRIDQQRQNAAPTPAASTVAGQSDPIVTNPEFIPARQASQDAVHAEPVLTTASGGA